MHRESTFRKIKIRSCVSKKASRDYNYTELCNSCGIIQSLTALTCTPWITSSSGICLESITSDPHQLQYDLMEAKRWPLCKPEIDGCEM